MSAADSLLRWALAHRQVASVINGGWLILQVVWVLGMFGNKRTRHHQSWGSWIIYIGLFSLTFCLLFDTRIFAGLKLIPDGPVAAAAGEAFFLAGFALALWTRFILGRNWSGRIALKENHELIEKGPYRVVRHPMYTGLILCVFGTAIVVGTLAAFIAVTIFTLVHLRKLRLEEALLLEHFPTSYPAYLRRTAALIPFVF